MKKANGLVVGSIGDTRQIVGIIAIHGIQIDLKNHHVYSFNPDIKQAKDIMIEAISQRLIKAQTEVERWAKAFKEIHI